MRTRPPVSKEIVAGLVWAPSVLSSLLAKLPPKGDVFALKWLAL